MDEIVKQRKKRITGFFKESTYRPLTLEELACSLAVPQEDMHKFTDVLEDLEREGTVFKTRKGRYGLTERMNLIAGRLQGNEKGFGFLIPDDANTPDVFIPAEYMNGAMHNDRVIARINRKGIAAKNAEGEIIKVTERANRRVVGRYERSGKTGFVIPDDHRISGDIFIPADESNGAAHGQMVVAGIIRWPGRRRNAEGSIEEVLGDSNEPGVDILSIIRGHNLRESFPQDVLDEAGAIPSEVTPEMAAGRHDLRQKRMVTIDGEDAKDLDDAVSIERLDNGHYMLGVHIADVSHYVMENSSLDREALKRGTSVYLVDRVLPMLPKTISNGICSLNPNVDRLAFTVMMEIDKAGRVLEHRIFESIINTNERMTYKDVYSILEENNTSLKERYHYLLDDFTAMKELALILHEKRRSRGSIDFDFDEAKVVLDDEGKPIEVTRYETTMANRLIEEFMLVCNETVAEHFYWLDIPFVYRIHEDPDPEKIRKFSEFVFNLGYTLKGIGDIHPGTLQELLEKVKGTREELIVSTVMLRSLQKAKYSHKNQGHFGLSARYYCHFTSPIRRYPDLIIHRIMKEETKGILDQKRRDYLTEDLAAVARHCSEREQAAQEAERDTTDLKKAEYMKQHIGSIFDGIISNVTSFGMFVELDNTIEGLVSMSDLYDDYYIYVEEHYSLVGEMTGKVYKIGQPVKIQVSAVNLSSRKIDFILAEGNRKSGLKKRSMRKKGRPSGKGRQGNI